VIIASINVSPVREVVRGGRLVRTGIFKTSFAGPVRLGERGFVGDDQADRKHHGHPTQAAYAFAAEEYPHWQAFLSRLTLPHGSFGENLTVTGLDDDAVCIGDVYRVGGARVEVTFPRVPCSTLAAALDSPQIVKAFLERARCGPYLRVLTPGEVGVGDAMTRESAHPLGLSLREAMILMHAAEPSRTRCEEAASIEAMDERWRTKFAAKAEGR
jgi:MOSC domain-containing protein YiiM